ncbi:MAG: hypothetical protein CVV42_02675 [Candidatus Riflebacteria bacterium HGW-Riflebacteria-2]|jgi:flagellin|nr:MAG: hypothetical protein CVV42_02675 [Candidatus Riflebacteria bacterium HGW-Riflebacteria-2]
MSLRINQNVVALSTYGNLTQTSNRLEKSIEKLSSGMRINRAADDAAGLSISEKMRRQIRGLNRAVLNAQDGVSMLQTAEGALNETHSILHRMRELAIQSSNDTLTSGDRLEIQKEVVQLRDDLDRISRNTEFNTKKLLDGSQTALISTSSSYSNGIVTGNAHSTGGDYEINLDLLNAGISQMQRSQIFAVKDAAGVLATGNTELQSIAQFYNANGVFILETPLSVTLNGNSKSASVILDAQMTLDDVASAFQNALNSSNALGIKNSRVATINTVQTNVAGLGGYLEVISGNVGEMGEFSLSGDQSVIDALGMNVSRASANSRVELTLRDSFGNVKNVKTETSRAVGLLNGIDVIFDSQPAQIAGTSGLESGLLISAAGGETFNLTIGASTVEITLATGFWTMEGLTRSINHQIATATETGLPELLGLKATVVEGEIRLAYDKPATAANTLPTSIVITSATQSTIGLVNGIYSGFVDGVKRQSAVEWGFSRFVASSKYDILANTDVIISISDGVGTVPPAEIVLMQTLGTAGADLLEADMVAFKYFQASANQALLDASVAVRIDQHGGAMAFTSLRVGDYHKDGGPTYTSLVSLNMADDLQSVFMQSKFGVKEGTAIGTGDANYRMHVVDSAPQFHIGADQGQTMRIGIADMSSKALGVENIDLTTVTASQKALGKINKAIDLVSSERSKMGAFQNRLEYAINNLRNTHANLTASESRIRDVDVAHEMIEFTRNQIVSQSGTAMLAQANLIPQGVLQLLQ